MSRLSTFKKLAIAAGLSLAAFSSAQQPNFGVKLIKQITLSTFGSGSGNDCWGYVSPTGREYAIVGLNNKVAFVEITNPASPTIVATIPHSSSTWGDIKVYGHYAYAVTETSGTGIQVIDMANIDSGVVTLVKTITNPGRSHNLVLNPASGYLYTCGSNEGTGTTMCFSLLDPANPVKIGPNSMTTNYQHDANVVNYTSGALAGRELWFGCSEGRGVDIYDMTDKNNPFLVKRVIYPTMGYCHQAWLSADRKYLYVDDELDESNSGGTMNTRSLIFNVEDPANAFYIGSFTSGLPSIDHNQYVVDGFTFQANYQSGLRIFDLSKNPEAPTQVGAYDTYPSSDGALFNGAWSNYPFFPSGTMIVSDINGGLFILDATEATTRNFGAASFTSASTSVIGGLPELLNSDDNRLTLNYKSATPGGNPLAITFSGYAYDTSPTKIRLTLEAQAHDGAGTSGSTMDQVVELYDWNAAAYVAIDTRKASETDQAITVSPTGSIERFVNQTDKQILARVRWLPTRVSRSAPPTVNIDQFQFKITR